jgi:polyhydroxybutyrate depolymerase
MPLLLVLHGSGGTGVGTVTLTHMNDLADQQDVIAFYPDGLNKGWADGRGASDSDQRGVDDVAFFSQLITTLEGQYAIDPHRVYVTGISNGGFMTQRLGCELADRIAAIVPVVATLSTNQAATCAPSRPMPILYILGENDPLVPYNGGTVRGDRGTTFSATDSLAAWAKFDGCTGAPTTRTLPDRVQDDTHVSETLYTNCQGGAQVGLYSVAGGGHTWPSGEQYLPAALVGRTTRQIDNGDLWAFLSQFQTP